MSELYIYSTNTDLSHRYIELFLKNKYVKLERTYSILSTPYHKVSVKTSKGEISLHIYNRQECPSELEEAVFLEVVEPNLDNIGDLSRNMKNHTNLYASMEVDTRSPPLGKLFLEKFDDTVGTDILELIVKKECGQNTCLQQYDKIVDTDKLVKAILDHRKVRVSRDDVNNLINSVFL